MTPPEDELLTPGGIQSPDLRRQQDIETCQIGLSSSFDQEQKDETYNTMNHVRFEEFRIETGVAINLSSMHSVPGERKRFAAENIPRHDNKRQRSV
jgi:hypothetical protein